MKLSQISLIFLLVSQTAFSQFEFGIKGGLNFDSAGKISKLNDDIISDGKLKSKAGFNLGVYAQIDLMVFYLRPELQYTRVNNSFEEIDIKTSRIELPVSLGKSLIGPLSLFAGPTAFYTLSSKTNFNSFENIDDKLNLGYHIGTRLNLGDLGIDIRYEKGVSKMATKVANIQSTDIRPNQVILGLSLKFN